MRRIISIFTAIIIFLSLCAPVIAESDVFLVSSTVTSGVDGNITWKLADDGTLTISGTGDMTNYSTSSYAPWYSSRSSIKSVVIDSGVKSIGEYAFNGYSNLTSVIIPDSVTSIGNSAFSGCTGLTSIHIPDSVTRINAYTFDGCSGLTEVTIGNNITNIDIRAFYGCSGLTSIVIPDGVMSIGWGAFYGCSGLVSIEIPGSVTSMGEMAFSECNGLKNVTLNEGVTYIAPSFFRSCHNIESVKIPKSIRSIESWAFEGCSSLYTVVYLGSLSEWSDISITAAGNNYLKRANIITFDRVTYDYTTNGGISVTIAEQFTQHNTYADLTPTAKKPNNRFIGWNIDSKATTALKNYTVTDDVTLYAIFEPIMHTVTYDYTTNGGDSSTAATSVKIQQGSNADLTPTATKTNFKFLGWNTSSEAVMALESYTVSDSVILYAIFMRTHANILYDYTTNKGDSASVSIKTVPINTDADLTPAATKPNHHFIGWNTDPNATTALESYTVTDDITLYAIFEPIMHTVIYDYTTNGGDSATVTSLKIQQGLGTDLTPTASKTNYEFVGWNTDQNATTALESYTVTDDVTLYAIFKPIIHTVTYDYTTNGGGSATVTSLKTEQGLGADLTPTASKTNYEFVGWNTDPNATTALESYVVTDDTTLYAIFKPIIHTVTYDYTTNGGDSSTATESVKIQHGSNANLTPTATKPNCRFIGWNTDPNATTALESYTVTEDVTLYAIFEPIKYTVTYDYSTNGGKDATVTTLDVQQGSNADLTPTASKTDYEFLGWNTDPTATTALESYVVADDVTLYAIFRRTHATVTYDYTTNKGNSASVTTAKALLNTNADLTPTATKTDYEFLGWNTDPTATTVLESYTVTDDVTLYAIFKKNICTITYNYSANGGRSVTTSTSKTAFGAPADLTPTATKTGWEFVGWNTVQNATEGLTEYIVNDDTTLYAIYRKATELQLTAANGQNQIVYLYNNDSTMVTMSAPLEYEGWTAEGWRTDTKVDEPTVNIGDKISASSSTKYYAIYSRVITLTYDSDGGEEIEPIQYTQYCNVNGSKTIFYPRAIKAKKYGYHFKYWEAEDADEPYYETQQIELVDSLVLTAVYERLPVVTYDYATNGGTSVTVEQAPVADDNYNTVDLSPIAHKEGWDFVGWSINANAKTGESNIWKVDGDITVYAIFKHDLKVRYIDKYQEVQAEDIATMYNNDTYASYYTIDNRDARPVYFLPRDIDDDTAEIINADMAYLTWERVGWRTDTEPNPVVIDNTKPQQLSHDTDFYAIYKQEFYTRYYMDSITENFQPYPFYGEKDIKYFNSAGNEGTVTTTIDWTFNYEGCTFIGWQEKKTGALYKNGDTVETNKRLNLAALWKTNKPETVADGKDVPDDITPSGTYIWDDEPVEVKLAHKAGDVNFYYTTDGTVPTVESTKYRDKSLYISDGLTLNVIAEAKIAETEYASPSEPVTFTYHKATAPHINAIDTYGKEVVIRFEQPENIDEKDITVKALDVGLYSETEQASDDMWMPLDSTVESKGVIRATGLKPLTKYMFKVECEYQNGTLDSNKVLGKTTEYLSSACDVEKVIFPIGAYIDQENLNVTSARVMNVFDEISVRLQVSNNATWELYSSRTAAERGLNPIANNTVKLDAGVSKTMYIKVTAEDKQTQKIYTMQLYRQSKSSVPVFSVPNGVVAEGTSLTLSAQGDIIKYTTDGSNPSESNGMIYTSPIVIDQNVTIKAVAKEADKDEYSDVITNVYYLSENDITPEIINTNYINGGCYINFNMLNNTDRSITGIAVVALYDENDYLIDIKTKDDFYLPADSMLSDNIEMTFITEKHPAYYKIFVWDDLQHMTPILTVPQQGNFI